jgi:hypothetical protein
MVLETTFLLVISPSTCSTSLRQLVLVYASMSVLEMNMDDREEGIGSS